MRPRPPGGLAPASPLPHPLDVLGAVDPRHVLKACGLWLFKLAGSELLSRQPRPVGALDGVCGISLFETSGVYDLHDLTLVSLPSFLKLDLQEMNVNIFYQ